MPSYETANDVFDLYDFGFLDSYKVGKILLFMNKGEFKIIYDHFKNVPNGEFKRSIIRHTLTSLHVRDDYRFINFLYEYWTQIIELPSVASDEIALARAVAIKNEIFDEINHLITSPK